MPFNESLADRVRKLLARRKGFTEKKMFGGLGFLLNGNMCVGIWKDSLIVRVGPKAYKQALAEPFTKEFDITGRPMNGWIMVEPEGFAEDAKLQPWVTSARNFVNSLPTKVL